MCELKELFIDSDGFILQCNRCGYFQVAFGTTILTLNQDQYREFVEMVSMKLEEANLFKYAPDLKCNAIPTYSFYVQCILTRVELQWLCNALETADDNLKVNQLLDLLNV